MRTDLHPARGLFGGEAGTQRKSAANTLGRRQDVGLDAILLVSIERAGSRDPALHLVENQHQIMLVGKVAQTAHECLGGRTNAAFALDRLDQEADRKSTRL